MGETETNATLKAEIQKLVEAQFPQAGGVIVHVRRKQPVEIWVRYGRAWTQVGETAAEERKADAQDAIATGDSGGVY